jgi:DNA polymerase-3 subunit epsilon
MLDMYLSAHEEEALIEVATNLGFQRDQLTAIHATYLDSLAIAAWADGVVTDDEHEQLTSVAGMLGLPPGLVRVALDRAERVSLMSTQGATFKLHAGDQVVFTGELSIPREKWIKLATDVGLVHGGMSKTTKLVVAADPDSQSGKAAKARSYGIPVVSEAAFARLLSDLS